MARAQTNILQTMTLTLQQPTYRPTPEALPYLRGKIKDLKKEYKAAKIRRSMEILATIAELQQQIEWIENNNKVRKWKTYS